MKCLALVSLLLVVALRPGLAVAETPAQRTAAKQAFVEGDAAFKAGDFERALTSFSAGYELSQKPRFLLNVGHSQRKLGKLREAEASYKKFLDTHPKADDRALAQQMLDEVSPLVAQADAEAAQRQTEADRAALLAQDAPADVQASTQPVVAEPDRPLYKRWYFWAGVGAVVAVGVLGGIALSSSGDGATTSGSWGQLRL